MAESLSAMRLQQYRFDQSAPFIVYLPIADMDLQSIAIVLQLVCPITQREAAWR